MHIDLDKDDLRQGVLGLVMALVEVIRDALQAQSIKRMEGGSLTPEQVERLGVALIELDRAIESIKDEHNIKSVVNDIHNQLDNLVGDVVDALARPIADEARKQGSKERMSFPRKWESSGVRGIPAFAGMTFTLFLASLLRSGRGVSGSGALPLWRGATYLGPEIMVDSNISSYLDRITCAFCKGKGKDPFGLLSRDSICQVCNGLCEHLIVKPHVECAYCHGSGVEFGTRNTCLSCGGRGRISTSKEHELCDLCRGRGMEQDTGLGCLRCKGAGVVGKG